MSQLLYTKLFRPRLPSGLVTRSQLDARFGAGIGNARLTLISAPAGFGKTTAVVAWIQQQQLPNAWLTLDEQDNQLDRFLGYVVAAVQQLDPSLGMTAQAVLQSLQLPDASAVLTALINDLVVASRRLILVLDDYHRITELAIHQALSYLLDHAPPQLHLVLITRQDPPFPLARWRVRDMLTELRAHDLRFSSQETVDYLHRMLGLRLPDTSIELLAQRTEGWIAALQLAALSLREHADPEGFIRTFSGSDRFVADYLLEEVLRQQRPERRLFLLCTAVLDRFSADLCLAVLADLPLDQAELLSYDLGTCRSAIEQLDAANLFVVPLDTQREWYRYHHLFADLLRSRLRREYPQLWPLLHRRASIWHEQAGNLDEAMHYALAIDDLRRATGLLAQYAMWLMNNAFLGTLLRWVAHIPVTILLEQPFLCVAAAWAYILNGQEARAVPFIDAGETLLDRGAPLSLQDTGAALAPDELRAHFAGQRSFVAQKRGQFEEAIRLAREALATLSDQHISITPLLFFSIGHSYYQRGAFEPAQEALRATAERVSDGTMLYLAVSSRSIRATLLADRGELDAAIALYREAILVGTQQATQQASPPLVYPLLNLAWIAYRQNDLPQVEDYLCQAETLAARGGLVQPLLWIYLLRARRDCFTQQFEQAVAWIERAAALIDANDGLRAETFNLAIARAQLALRQGKLIDAEHCLRQCGVAFDAFKGQQVHSVPGYQFFTRHQAFFPTLAHLLIAQDRLLLAGELLDWLAQAAADLRHLVVAVQSALLQAVLAQRQQRSTQAQAALERALERAAPQNLLRVVLEFGFEVGPLLLQALPRSAYASFIQQLLDAPELASARAAVHHEQASLAPLTQREIQILRLLAVGLTSTEIAQQLVIAPSTVRSYIKSLYGKLDVNRRHEAIERARTLKLL